MKEIIELQPADFATFPVWKFTGEDDPSDSAVVPATALPVHSLQGTIVGAEVALACGQKRFAMISNIDVQNPVKSALFVVLTFFNPAGGRFHLARYFDDDRGEFGPDQLAQFLNLSRSEIFPIAWDVTPFAVGNVSALRGTVNAEPAERLSRYEIIRLNLQ